MAEPHARRTETHQRILDAAGRLFRQGGIDGVGVDAVMKEAGLTHGGFFAHFASKEALAAEVRGEGPAAKSSGAGRKTTTVEVPEGHLLINVEKFKAHLTLIDRLPKGVGEKIIESLVGSQLARSSKPNQT
jgi:hypothetical protein